VKHYEDGTAGAKIIAYLVRYYGRDEDELQRMNGWDLVRLREELDKDALDRL
jgi:hypothetical protein